MKIQETNNDTVIDTGSREMLHFVDLNKFYAIDVHRGPIHLYGSGFDPMFIRRTSGSGPVFIRRTMQGLLIWVFAVS